MRAPPLKRTTLVRTALSLGLGLVLLHGAAAAQAADAARGADLFDANCAECHSVAKSMKNKKGPALFGVVGRAAAAVAGYEYSDGLRAAGFTWDAEKLDAYLAHPKALVPGGKMKFDGLEQAGERADIIAFLTAQH